MRAALLAQIVQGSLLDFESVQLESKHAAANPAVRFAQRDESALVFGQSPPPETECRAFPGSDDWPSDSDWRSFNQTLGGALLKPLPPAAACYVGPNYDAAKCRFLVTNATNNHFYLDDPVTVLTQWPQGNTCPPALNATGTCTQGGFPVYVVNATSVKHVQLAVNFARNNNIRLIIKNTGHDFGGRSAGAGSLSIWTHHLKEFQFLQRYTKGNYSGMAAHFGSGLETWELFNYMYQYGNLTIAAAGVLTVGGNGGWFASGGHGNVASFYGLGADQALEIHVVTADGRFLVASAEENEDLFFALRGGGGSTYGVVTSIVVKVYPPINLVRTSLSIACRPPADTNTRALFAPVNSGTFYVNDTALFWKALGVYFRFKRTIVDGRGTDWEYLYPLTASPVPANGTLVPVNGTIPGNGTVPGNSSSIGTLGFTYRVGITFPNRTVDQVATLLAPLYASFAAVPGLGHITLRRADIQSTPYSGPASVTSLTALPASPLSATRYRSRLFPRANWATDPIFESTMAAIRSAVEDGRYIFHGLSIGPTAAIAGYPGRTAAVNPAWREAVLHAILITSQPAGLTAQAARDEEARIQAYMRVWRAVSPGAGAYMNEADPGEPDWQQAFYGANYPRLLAIKRRRDPWGVFWAQTTVGSDAWEVRTLDGYPRSQNGRLCRVSQVGKTTPAAGAAA
ncbi:hypothetical protein B0T26DRAFT_750045 [Lasiosphaeria miniovina]|uniref:FAD-binding PCMH-type domain-containing protein n=1 Tax=Lasiosphaeria miniovina TaxID=1954250 RepID=A0AA40E0P7_9PEZI|nr:uncharacterized protein B0T26DRAFT_750045 [Lasiosphaeria miniovina]KAK0722675.1 hypothetical protein B0T26DRAFT_750045 [Lasiosphaeria miniovina]